MQHTESSVKIYFTKQYGSFRMILGNRQLSDAKIKRIRKDIAEGLDVLKYCPIIVVEKDGKLNIVDGQHRFWVAKQLGSQVWYVIASELNLQEIAKINSNTERWKDKDFINCYAQLGNRHYIQLQEFLDETGFPLSTSLSLLTFGGVKSMDAAGGSAKQRFRDGKFQIKFHKEALGIAEKVQMFKTFPGHTSGAFIEAVCRILQAGKINLADIHSKWMEYPDMLEKQSNAKEYLVALEVIMNKGAKIRKVIY